MTVAVEFDEAFADGAATPPRDNGELVFGAPWEARAFAMAVELVQRGASSWDTFRARLIEAIADDPERPYYESWVVALETLVVDLDLASAVALEAARPADRPVL